MVLNKGEAEKLDEAAGGLCMAQEVEVSTETTGENPENPDYRDDDEEDVKEDDKDDNEEEVADPEWQEETAVQVFVD